MVTCFASERYSQDIFSPNKSAPRKRWEMSQIQLQKNTEKRSKGTCHVQNQRKFLSRWQKRDHFTINLREQLYTHFLCCALVVWIYTYWYEHVHMYVIMWKMHGASAFLLLTFMSLGVYKPFSISNKRSRYIYQNKNSSNLMYTWHPFR